MILLQFVYKAGNMKDKSECFRENQTLCCLESHNQKITTFADVSNQLFVLLFTSPQNCQKKSKNIKGL